MQKTAELLYQDLLWQRAVKAKQKKRAQAKARKQK